MTTSAQNRRRRLPGGRKFYLFSDEPFEWLKAHPAKWTNAPDRDGPD